MFWNKLKDGSQFIDEAEKIAKLMKEDGFQDLPTLGETNSSAMKKVLHYIKFLREKKKRDLDGYETTRQVYEKALEEFKKYHAGDLDQLKFDQERLAADKKEFENYKAAELFKMLQTIPLYKDVRP